MNDCTTRGQCLNSQLMMVTELSFICLFSIDVFIVFRVVVDLESVLGMLGMRQECILDET